MKKIIYILIFFFFPLGVFASTIEVKTPVVDHELNVGDLVKGKLIFENNTSAKRNVHVFIDDIDSGLSTWLKISPSFEIGPREVKEVSYEINTLSISKPGKYHSILSFPNSLRREDAKKLLESSPEVIFNLEILNNLKEAAQLNKFTTGKVFNFSYPIKFIYEITNVGDLDIDPAGEIYLYDRRGKLVDVIEVKNGEAVFEPDKLNTLATVWYPENNFGRYKAMINLRYGKDHKVIQDTLFFWIIPWQFLLIFVSGTIFLLMFIFHLIKKKI